MRRIKLFEEFINERKSIGIIYHFTNFASLENILDENAMIHSPLYQFISFTRNPNLEMAGGRKPVRIAFDGDALSDNYKIEPFMYDPEKDELFTSHKPLTTYQERKKQYGEEREERVKTDEIKNIRKYIIEVDVKVPSHDPSLDTAEDLFDKLEELRHKFPGMQFNTVTSFKRVYNKVSA